MRNPGQRELSDADLVAALRALADPTRFRMVQEIATAHELSCSDVIDRFDLAQPTISHHLKLLVEAGILCCRSEGKHRFFCVDTAVLEKLAELLPFRLSPAASARRTRSLTRE